MENSKKIILAQLGNPFTAAVLLAVVTTALHLLFNNYAYDDIVNYYAPMAREFSRANYDGAFFHGIPPLMAVLAGIISKTGVHCFTACVLVSSISFIAALWPLRRLLLNFVAPKYASWACLIFAISPRIIKYSGAGLLTSVKLFFVVWIMVLIIEYARERKFSQLVWLGANLAGLALIRGEGILYVPFFYIWALIFLFLVKNTTSEHEPDTSKPKTKSSIYAALKASLIVGVSFLVLISPRLYQLYKETGMPALDSRQSELIKSVLGKPTLQSSTEHVTESEQSKQPEQRNAHFFPKRLQQCFKAALSPLDVDYLENAVLPKCSTRAETPSEKCSAISKRWDTSKYAKKVAAT